MILSKKRFLVLDFVEDKSLEVEIFFLNPVTNQISVLGFFARILTKKLFNFLNFLKNKISFLGF